MWCASLEWMVSINGDFFMLCDSIKMMVCLAGIVYVVCLHEVPGVIVPSPQELPASLVVTAHQAPNYSQLFGLHPEM